MTTGKMTVDIPAMIWRMRAQNRRAESLLVIFPDMDIKVAQKLLSGELDMTSEGYIYSLSEV